MSKPEKRNDHSFLVYIVESPSQIDLYHKRYEGEALAKALTLAGIPSEHKLVVSEEALRASFAIGLKEVLEEHPGHLPIIHLSAHGAEKGIQLTNERVIDWKRLREILGPVNTALKGHLLLCMSACHGFSACRMAFQDGDIPFGIVVGNSGDPTWSDTTVGYAAFYHLLKKGKSISDAVQGMRAASGDNRFMLVYGADAQRIYLDDLQKVEPATVEAAVDAQIGESGANSLQKALSEKEELRH